MHSVEKKDELSIVNSGACWSLSGNTKINYEFGVSEAGELQVRIAGTSGKGTFSKGWVSMKAVQQVLAGGGSSPIAYNALQPLYGGQSINTAGFLLAVLLHVGLVERSTENPRCYQPLSGEKFFASIKGTATAKVNKSARAAP
jgi:hypothetical protein